MTATSPPGQAVPCRWLTFAFGHGSGSDVLTADTRTIVAAPGPTTPWAIWGSGDGVFRAVPLPPTSGLDANDRIEFVFSSIVVNDVAGDVDIEIDQDAPTAPIPGKVTVSKNRPADTGAVPRIAAFAASPTQVAAGGQTTLSWQVADAQTLVLEPGPIPLASVQAGSLPLTVQQTTIYTLRAFAAGGVAEQQQAVTVEPVAVDAFTATPPAAGRGAPVTLAWSTRFASSCSIDQGVGPVPVSGSVVVAPQQTTVYTLTALGLGPQARTVTVDVT